FTDAVNRAREYALVRRMTIDNVATPKQRLCRRGTETIDELANPGKKASVFSDEYGLDLNLSEASRDAMLRNYYWKLYRLGKDLIQVWAKFYRQVSPNWTSERNSLIPLPQP